MYQFRLMYAVPDSDRSPIKHNDNEDEEKATPWLFNSVEEAIKFREKNELFDVHPNCFYWIIPDKYFRPKDDDKPKLSYCYIELAE